MILYKYTTADDYVIQSLIGNDLFFRRMSNLNDPHEGSFKITGEEFKRTYMSNDDNGAMYALLNEFNDDFRNGTFICSLSESSDNQAMWAYYAKEHSGLRIEYEINDNVDDSFTVSKEAGRIVHSMGSSILHKVSYGNKKILINWTKEEDSDSTKLLKLLYPAIVAKSPDWDHENEWRIILRDNSIHKSGITVKLKPNSVKSLTFGCNVQRDKIDSVLTRLRDAGMTGVRCLRAIRSPGEHGLLYVNIDF